MAGSIKSLDDLECVEPPKNSQYIIKHKEGLTIPNNEIVAWFDNVEPRDLLFASIKEAFVRGDTEFEIRRNYYIHIANHNH